MARGNSSWTPIFRAAVKSVKRENFPSKQQYRDAKIAAIKAASRTYRETHPNAGRHYEQQTSTGLKYQHWVQQQVKASVRAHQGPVTKANMRSFMKDAAGKWRQLKQLHVIDTVEVPVSELRKRRVDKYTNHGCPSGWAVNGKHVTIKDEHGHKRKFKKCVPKGHVHNMRKLDYELKRSRNSRLLKKPVSANVVSVNVV